MNLFRLFGEIAINTQNAKDEIGNVSESAKKLSENLNKTSEAADTTSKKLGSTSKLGASSVWLGNMFTTLTSKAISFISSISKTGFDYNAQMETYITSFTTMLGGNATEAEAFIGKIRDLASKTPMEMTGLAGNAQTLLGFGIASENVIETLRMLGDVAQGDQQKLDSIVLAYSQIMAAGKLNAQDANQLVSAGVPIWNMLAEEIGATVGEIREMSEDGAVSADAVTKAFQSATDDGGLFYQAMEKQAETFNGQLSTLKDNADQTVGSLFQPFFDVAKSEVLPKISESLAAFGEWVSNNKETIKEFATAVGNLVTSGFDSALSFFQWIVENKDTAAFALGAIATVVGTIAIKASPLSAVVIALSAIVANWGSIVEGLQPAIEAWNTLIGKIDDACVAAERFFGINKGSSVNISSDGVSYGGGAGKGFANGLSRVPYNDFPALLHKDETVLNRMDAREWRFAQATGGTVVGTGRLESLMGNMVLLMQQMVTNYGNGQTIVLDSGALVGQIAPQMDARLGTISGRKGRGN